MECSIIVCTRNRYDKLKRCLDSISHADLGDSYELIVIDQSDVKSELDNISNLRYVWRKGKGLAIARNEAIKMAKGDILCFTDDDCVVTRDWFENIRSTFAIYPLAEGVFGKVLAYSPNNYDRVEHHQKKSVYGETTYAIKPGPYFCLALFAKDTFSIHDKPCLPFANLGSGNNMAFRHSIFDKHGLFLTRLGAGSWLKSAEDTEFHYRLLKSHCQLIYNPKILVFHDNWVDLSKNASIQDGYTCGVVATWLFYSLKGDPLAWEFLKSRWQSVTNEILAYSEGRGLSGRIKYGFIKRRALMKGIVGGLWLKIISVFKSSSMY